MNFGNNQEATTLELTKKVKAAKYKSTTEFNPLPKDDPKRGARTTAKLERLVGWNPNVCFDEGLRRTIDWFSLKQ